MTRKIVTVDATTLALPADVENALKADLETEFDTQVTVASDAASSAAASAAAAEAAAAEATAPTQEMVDNSILSLSDVAATADTLALRNGAGQVAVSTPSSGSHAVNVTYLESLGLLAGETGKEYKIVACTLRNDGSPDYWQPLDDAGHSPANVDSVSTTASQITLNYAGIGASKVVGFAVGCDETLISEGYEVGASVGLSSATLELAMHKVYGDNVQYAAGVWTSTGGTFTLSYNATNGVLTCTHPEIPAIDDEVFVASVSPRNSTLLPLVYTTTTSTVQVQWFAPGTGTIQTVASTAQRAFVTHGASGPIDCQQLDTTIHPGSNIWVLGIFEVA